MNRTIDKLNGEINGLIHMRDKVGNSYYPISSNEAFHLLFDKKETLSSFDYVEGKYVLTHYKVSERTPKMIEILGLEPEPYLTEWEDGSEEGFRASSLSVTDILKKEFMIGADVNGFLSSEDREKLTEVQEEKTEPEYGKDYLMLRNGVRVNVGDKIFVHPTDLPITLTSEGVDMNGQYCVVSAIKESFFIVDVQLYYKPSKSRGNITVPVHYTKITAMKQAEEKDSKR